MEKRVAWFTIGGPQRIKMPIPLYNAHVTGKIEYYSKNGIDNA